MAKPFWLFITKTFIDMKKQLSYVAPDVEYMEVDVESGFASTGYQDGDYPGDGWNNEEEL